MVVGDFLRLITEVPALVIFHFLPIPSCRFRQSSVLHLEMSLGLKTSSVAICRPFDVAVVCDSNFGLSWSRI